jgi:phycocyanobilin:ferredoxin oxidoreductase
MAPQLKTKNFFDTIVDTLSAEEAALALSMGSWRLRPKVTPVIEALVAQIEGSWRVVLDSDLKLYSLPPQYRYMDSLDPGNSKELPHQLPDPVDKEDPAYPRLQVENRAYSSYAFRKLHLEVAVRQDGLQVVHCVMYPKPEFDLPILSLDLVANGDRVSLAIIDPCPVTGNLSLPPFYVKSTTELQIKYGLESNRTIPEWGSAIFSKLCVIVRPESPQEVAKFLKYAIALANFHVQIGRLAVPVGGAGTTDGDRHPEEVAKRRAEIKAAHARYSAKQLENDKTRKVLEKSFGSGPSEDYMRTVMFDS